MQPTVPLYRSVLDQLRADMRSGELAVGATLPSEQELCDRFGVSRITVRRALDELAQEGRIDRGAGRATRVTAPRLVHAIAAFEDPFGPLRLVRDTELRLLSFDWCVAEGPIAQALQVDDDDQVLRIARLRSRDSEPVFHTTAFLPAWVGSMVNRKALEATALHDVLAAAGHVPAAIQRQMSAAPCPKAVARSLGLRAGAPTFRIDRLSRNAEGRPLHLLVGYWRWDRFSMRLTSDATSEGGTLIIDEADTSGSRFLEQMVDPAKI